MAKKTVNKSKTCEICGKGTTSAYNRPNSLHRTKRKIHPNLQKKNNKLICTNCLKNSEKI